MKKTPFQFLDAYTLEDRERFFGRDKEIEDLYAMVFKTSLVLVYGLSGTGKTSLVECGLAARFDGPEWLPFSIRRQEDINASLRNSLGKALASLGAKPTEDLLVAIRQLYRYSYRPVYLIFDQFEELFILGTEAEQKEFVENLEKILNSGLPCKVILILREEYLGYLYPFEKKIPSLFDFRLRVEPMSTAKTKEVVASSFQQFNITLAAPEAENLQTIIDNISAEKSGIHLPFLQVYLDRLYFEKYREVYGQKSRNDELPPLEFTRRDILRFGDIENVLKKFIEDRKENLERELNARFNTRHVNVVSDVLDAFVTSEGTKRPVFFSWTKDGEEMQVEGVWRKFFPSVSDAYLSACFQLLAQNRILRISENTVELAHDSLAKLIDELRTAEQRQRKEIKRRILSNYREFQETKQYLSGKQLAIYEAFLPELELNDDVRQFIAASEAEVERKEREERVRRRRKMLQLLIGVSGVALAAILVAVFFIRLSVDIEESKIESELNTAESFKNIAQFDSAIVKLDSIKLDYWLYRMFLRNRIKEDSTKIDSLKEKYEVLRRKVSRADTLSKKDAMGNYRFVESLFEAKELYEEAIVIDPIQLLEEKAAVLARYIDRESKARVREADDILKRLGYDYLYAQRVAGEYIRIAQSLDPDVKIPDRVKKATGVE